MVNLNSEYPDKEGIQESFDRISARLRDDVMDLQLLFKRVIEGNTYLSKKETADFLRCDVSEIPARLKRYRVGNNYIFRKSDITEYLDSRCINKGGKK